MAVRVGINGFGRIGRNFLRALLALDSLGKGSDIELVAVNDMVNKDVLAYLLEYDSTYGRLGYEVEETSSGIRVAARDVALLSEPDPKAIPWGDLGVEVVVESTGRFTSRSAAAAHLRSLYIRLCEYIQPEEPKSFGPFWSDRWQFIPSGWVTVSGRTDSRSVLAYTFHRRNTPSRTA